MNTLNERCCVKQKGEQLNAAVKTDNTQGILRFWKEKKQMIEIRVKETTMAVIGIAFFCSFIAATIAVVVAATSLL